MDYTGHTISHYHVVEKLGFGGMATVYRAYDTRLERDVAIKVVRKEAIPPEDLDHILKRFEREAKSLAKFMHPNIVPVYDYGDYEGAPYIVMAYLPGGTLTQFLRDRGNKPVPAIEAAEMLIPAADALSYAHKRGVIHRDVKPSNMLITDEGVMMLSDFGIAKLLEEDLKITQTNMLVGTPDFMAPEQWLHKVVPASDQYALGVVLYEMLTGQRPFHAETPAAIVIKQASEPLMRPSQLVSGIPEAAEQVLYKVLAKNIDDRYSDMDAFKQALIKITNESIAIPTRKGKQQAQPVRVPKHTDIAEDGETRDEFNVSTESARPVVPIKSHRFLGKASRKFKKLPAWLVWGGIGVILLGLTFGLGSKLVNLRTEDANTLAELATATKIKTISITPSPSMTFTITPTFTVSPTRTPNPTHTRRSTWTLSPTPVYSDAEKEVLSNMNQFTLDIECDHPNVLNMSVYYFIPTGSFNRYSGLVNINTNATTENITIGLSIRDASATDSVRFYGPEGSRINGRTVCQIDANDGNTRFVMCGIAPPLLVGDYHVIYNGEEIPFSITNVPTKTLMVEPVLTLSELLIIQEVTFRWYILDDGEKKYLDSTVVSQILEGFRFDIFGSGEKCSGVSDYDHDKYSFMYSKNFSIKDLDKVIFNCDALDTRLIHEFRFQVWIDSINYSLYFR